MKHSATVARYSLVEALRSGLPWLAAACVIAVLGLSGFLSQVAITEATALQASTAGALLATLFALPLLFWAKPADLGAWWISLVVETALAAAAALFFASALTQTVHANRGAM